jgi:uncharacterized repeat protein (TIGR04052 family)
MTKKTFHVDPLLLGATLALSLALLAGCGKSDSASTPCCDVPADRQVAVRFKGLVGGDPFSCTSTYAGIGTNPDPAKKVLTPKDLRFYVHDLELVTPIGSTVRVSVTDDGKWQHAGVALIDLEDGRGTCSNGNADTNDRVVGTVPAGDYVGLRFKLGVPADLNHLNVATQPSPLNLTAMFWSWTNGYRFLRIEGSTPGAILHLGATACTPVDPNDATKGATCANGNRAQVAFPSFNVDTNRVALDLKDLWDATDLTTNTPGTAGGCMSSPNDADCAPIFRKLGLPFGGQAASAQTLFTVE